MELGIASPNEEKKMQMARYQAQVAPLAPPKPGIAEEFGGMVKKRAMESALNTGQKMVTSGIKPYTQGVENFFNPAGSAGAGSVAGQAATNAALANAGMTGGAEIALAGQSLAPSLAATGAGGAGMATLATAVPYVGAGLLAGKALGLFNEGGMVGPLGTQYKAGGGYSIPNPLVSEATVVNAYDDYLSRLPSPDESTLSDLALGYADFKDMFLDKNAIKFNQGGQVGLNNTDEINRILDEIEAESMVEGYQQEIPMPQMRPPLMAEPMNADTTYNPYNMMSPDNVPST
jgi:hypothetical protein